MSKQLNVSLVFSANTSQAKQQIQNLQTNISQLQSSLNHNMSMNGFTQELGKAQNAVVSLKQNLTSAFDVNTGKLDLTKFNNNLKQSGMQLKDYRNALQLLGPEGQKSFYQLTQAIVQGQMPIRKTTGLLNSMMKTFGTSIKYSIAYGVINKITQGIQEAIQYSKDLNKSLTDIGVVTNQNAQQMASFADKANKAAKALATTTVEYANASLIYFQQGLNEEEAMKRAAVTIKLANVTGESAQVVSEQLTAVWNNFYDGSKSLEYYADVMAALGAATASSADEIAEGLEKFAAVAETVGLSYEYATTALATVTAQTRQSADVVGTAFKTLFARIQDLDLGKTLDDGTTLGSYSYALEKVGINIKDSAGNLKQMDTILEEMGERWNTLDKDQQTALAQSVAGVRQYTQLIALMDNWEQFELNLNIAETSGGTLESQQKIWAESWEAASNRVKAASEGLFNSLVDDKFFINLNNVFADLIESLDEFIEAMGGLKTLIPLIGGMLLKTFGPSMATGLANLRDSLIGPTKAQIAQNRALQKDSMEQANLMAGDADSDVGYTYQNNYNATNKLYNAASSIDRPLTDKEMGQVQELIQVNQQWQEIALKSAEVLENINRQNEALKAQGRSLTSETNAIKEDFLNQVGETETGDPEKLRGIIDDADKQMGLAQQSQLTIDDFRGNASEQNYLAMRDKIRQSGEQIGQTAKELFGEDLWKQLKSDKIPQDLEGFAKKLDKVDLYGKQAEKTTEKLTNATKEYGGGVKDGYKTMDKLNQNLQKMHPRLQSNAAATRTLGENNKKVKESAEQAEAALLKMNKVPLGETIMSIASGLGSMAAGLSMAYSGFQSFTNMFKEGEFTISGFLGALTSIGFALPMVINGLRSLATTQAIVTAVTKTATGARLIENAMAKQSISLETAETALKKAGLSADIIELTLQKMRNGESLKEALFSTLKTKGKEKETAATWKHVAALIAEKVAAGPVMWIIMAIMVAVAAVTAGFIALFKVLQAGTPEAKLKAANEQLDSMKKNLEETKNKYNELNDAISNYKEAQTAISSLTEGTQAWKDSVFELNSQILELIQKYPTLKKFLESDNGVLSINEESFSQLQQEMIDTITTQQNNVISQSRYEENLKRNNKWEKFIENRTNETSDGFQFQTEDGAKFQSGYRNVATKDFMNAIKDAYLQYGDQIYDKNFSLDTFFEERYKKEGKTGYNYYKDLWSKDPIREDSEFQEYVRGFQEQIISDRKYYDMMAQNSLIDYRSDYKGAVVSQYSDAFQTAVETEKFKTDSGEEITRQQFMDNYFKNFLTETSGTDYHASVRGKFKNEYIDGIQSKKDMAKWLVSQATGATMSEIEAGDYQIKEIGGDTIKYKAKDSDEWTKVDYETYSQQLWEQYIKQETDKKVEEMDTDAQAVAAELQKGGLKSAKDSGALAKAVESWYDSGNETLDLSNFTRAEIKNVDTSKFKDENIKNAFDKGVQEYEQKLTEANLKATDDWFKNREQREAEELDSLLKASEMTIEDFEDLTKTIAKTRNVSADVAKSMAKDLLKTSQATKKLGEIYEDNNDVLKKGSKDAIKGSKQLSAAYITARNDIKDTIKEMTDVDLDDAKIDELIDDGTIEEAANNSEEAIKKIKLAAADQVLLDMDIDTSTEDGQDIFDKLQNQIEAVKNTDISLTPNIDIKDAIKELNALISSGQITAEQANKYLKSIGFSPVVETTKKKVTNHIDIWRHNINTGEKEHIVQDEVSTIDVPEIKDAKYEGFNTTTLPNSGGSKKSGGGGGSSSKKEKKTASNEIERYHEISKTLEDLNRELEEISKNKERAFGKDKLKYLDQEIKKQKELLEAEKQYKKEIEGNLTKDKNAIAKYGFEFDENGNISNYDEIMQVQIDKFNKLKTDKAEKEFEEFKKLMEQYEKTLALDKDQAAVVLEAEWAIEDMQLEQIETEVEIKTTAAEDSLTKLNYLLESLENNAFAAAEALKIMSAQIEEIGKKEEATLGGIEDILKLVNTNVAENDEEIITNAQAESLRGYLEDIISLKQELKDYRENALDKLSEAQEVWNTQLEKTTSLLENQASTLEHFKNLIDIVGKDNLGIDEETEKALRESVKITNKAMVDNAILIRNTKKEALSILKQEEAKLADDDEDGKRSYKERIDEMEEEILDAENTLQEALSNSLQGIVDSFSENINSIMDTFEKAISGIAGNLERLQEIFERQSEINERYLANYQKTYEISKLNRSIAQSIDKTDNLTSQKQLRDLQKQLLALSQDGVEVSQREIDLLQKKYDLMLAEQAFKDAQNAKSVVTLQKDSEGNYGYVYTADQTSVNNTEQTFEDKKYEYQKTSEETMAELEEMYLDTFSQLSERIRAITDDPTLTADEKEKRIKEAQSWAKERLDYIDKETGKLLASNAEMNELYGLDLVTDFKDTTLGKVYKDSGITSFSELASKGKDEIDKAAGQAIDAVGQMVNEVDEFKKQYGEAYKGNSIDEIMRSVAINTEQHTKDIADDAEAIKEAMFDKNKGLPAIASKVTEIFEKTQEKWDTTNNLIDKIILLLTDPDKYKEQEKERQETERKEKFKANNKQVTITGSVQDKDGNWWYKDSEDKYYKRSELYDVEGNSLDIEGQVGLPTHTPYVMTDSGTTTIPTTKLENANIQAEEILKNNVGKTFELIHGGEGVENSIPFYSEDEKLSYNYKSKDNNFGNVKYTGQSKVINGILYALVSDNGKNDSNFQYLNNKGLQKSGAEYAWVPVQYLSLGDSKNKSENLNKDLENLYKFDTGGYTGAWGPEGRMAMLHQKELILNAHDTENFLTAIGIVRDISNRLEQTAAAMRYDNQLAQFHNIIRTSDGTLQQEVTIHAEFPNATDHNEIEEAFRNLTNLASQYANRKS